MPKESLLGRFPLAPLTKGGNLPYRRLCREFGATATCSEMVYAHQLIRQSKGREPALLRHHPTEDNFGVQIAASKPNVAADAAKIAEASGAKFIDLNCGCPIFDTVKRWMGARLLQKLNKLGLILEAMIQAVDIPVTVKLRVGFSENKINIRETVQRAVDAGVHCISIHGRTREQRYSRSADWPLLAEIAAECPVPVLGNGDILTPMEAHQRLDNTELSGAVIARGALIKPWIFKEMIEDQEWLLSAPELWGILVRFTGFLKEHFGADDYGRKRGVEFLAWHLDWFSRYRPLPEADWKESAMEHPLLQTRSLSEPILVLPNKSQETERQELAETLWDSKNPENLWEQFLPEKSVTA